MANVLDNVLPKILARALIVLRETAAMPRVVNGDYSDEAAQKGDTIDVPIPTAVGVSDVTPSNVLPAPTDTTTEKVQIPLNNWRKSDAVFLTDKEMVEIDKQEHFLPMQMGESVRALANDINLSVHNQYRGVYGMAGTPGTTPFQSTVRGATQTRKLLNQQLAPKGARRGVLDFDAEAEALALSQFADAEKTLSNQVKIEGEIGRKYGTDWLADDQVVTHTAGTIDSGSGNRNPLVDEAGNLAIGAVSMDIDETSLTGTLVVGDIFTFAGHGQQYVVTGNVASAEFTGDVEDGTYTAATNAITSLTFQPALVAAVLDDEVITVEDTHVVNLVFHRDAFALAMRPLLSSSIEGLGTQMMTVQDPVTGLVLRLEVQRQYKQVTWEFDALWGVKLVRPQLATRLAG